MKKTKIVATIGPASADKKILKKMIEAGMNVARINFSHGTHESNGKLITILQELREEMKIPLGIMADLQGPRIRVGNAEAFELKKGEIILVSDQKTAPEGEKELIIDSDGALEFLSPGERILIEDGTKQLAVTERQGKIIRAEVLAGGTVSPRKGVNMPDTKLNLKVVSEKDEKDLEYALSREVDFVALSFVGRAQDIISARERIKAILGREEDLPQIVSKVERKEAIKNIDEIIEASDVVMVARGDLGIEMPETKVVLYQKEIIKKCLNTITPVIVATQMLDSMINNPLPTRAEVSDVSNAVIDHTDAVMLSGESANGKYPVEAVATMAKIIEDTEESPFDDNCRGCEAYAQFAEYGAVICSAHEMARNADVKAIIAISQSGLTTRMIAHRRPPQAILAATSKPRNYQQLSLVWGAVPFFFSQEEDREIFIDQMIERAKERKILAAGDKAVVILGRIPGGEKMRLVGIREI